MPLSEETLSPSELEKGFFLMDNSVNEYLKLIQTGQDVDPEFGPKPGRKPENTQRVSHTQQRAVFAQIRKK